MIDLPPDLPGECGGGGFGFESGEFGAAPCWLMRKFPPLKCQGLLTSSLTPSQQHNNHFGLTI